MKNPILFLMALAMIKSISASGQAPIEIRNGFVNETFLAKDQKDVYEVRLNDGGSLDMTLMQNGVDAVIDVFDPKGNKLQSFDSPNGKSGPEPVRIESNVSGRYRLVVHPFDDRSGLTDSAYTIMMEDNQGKYAITSVNVFTAKEYRQKMAAEKEAADRIIRDLNTELIPLKTVEAGNGFDDLQPLKSILKDVKIVGLGEATHGTREFFQMKHRMLEFLVKEMGYTVFGIEASYAGCKNINDYVLYGKGDAHTALASQGFWTWDTEEVIDMIEWMRKYNTQVAEEKKVKFTGFDIQVNSKGGGSDKIEAYLQKVDTIRYQSMKPILDSIDSPETAMKGDSMMNACLDFLSFFVMSKGLYVQRSSAEEYESILGYCRVLCQYVDSYFMNASDGRKQEREWRDYYMANNFFDLVMQEKPGTKFVLWAHNAHVSHNGEGYVNGGLRPFGSYLEEVFGDDYYAFGFAFNKGGFQAIEIDSLGKYGGLQEFIANPAREKSLDWYFAQTNQAMFILNFRKDSMSSYVNSILNSLHATRGFGAVARRSSVDQNFVKEKLMEEYDGIIFINETHRARPTETGMRKKTGNSFSAFPGDSIELTKLVRQYLNWSETNYNKRKAGDFWPADPGPTDTLYSGIDWNMQTQNMKAIEESKLFTKGFLDNYQNIGSKIDAALKSRKLIWHVGDLPEFGPGDANAWCNCQDHPEKYLEKVTITNLNFNQENISFSWTWGNNFLYDVKAKKIDGHWKIDYLQGFDIKGFNWE